MKHELEVDLMRLLHGELPADRAGALRDRLGREPELAAAYRRLESLWEGLTLPPPATAPLGFTGRVMARVRELRAAGALAPLAPNTLTWSAAPNWVRAAGAAALLAGLVLGAGLGARGALEERHTLAGVPSLTESYWVMVDESASAPALPSSPRGEARQ